jgi:hypothetical protein
MREAFCKKCQSQLEEWERGSLCDMCKDCTIDENRYKTDSRWPNKDSNQS